MKNLKSKKVILIVVLAILLIIGIAFGYSFAYFTASVINGDTINNTVVTTTALEIEFTDGPKVSLVNSIPGTSVEKTFKIENKGTEPTSYDVYMSEVVNTFADKSDLVYTITSNDGGYNTTSEVQVPDVNKKIIESQVINGGEEHNYTLKVEFKEKFEIQDDNKDKEFSVTIRVNEKFDAPENAVEKIKKIVKDENENSIDVIDKGSKDGCTYTLAYDGTSDNSLRYVGTNPCNYVSFNDETWKIIGVINNTQTASGQTESLLKIRRAESLGRFSWDSSSSIVNDGNGINQWGESTYSDGTPYEGADLMRELNTDYLGNITIGTDGYWYSGKNNNNTWGNMPDTTISNDAQNMIESVKWYLGAPNNDNGTYLEPYDSRLNALFIYNGERSNNDGKLCTSGSNCNDTVVRTTSWTGKVGLYYMSDYFYAMSGGTYTSRSQCLQLTPNDLGRYGNCRNWLYPMSFYDQQWTMTPLANSANGYGFDIFYQNQNSQFTRYGAYQDWYVSPVVYLKSSTNIIRGEGTSTNPYILG